ALAPSARPHRFRAGGLSVRALRRGAPLRARAGHAAAGLSQDPRGDQALLPRLREPGVRGAGRALLARRLGCDLQRDAAAPRSVLAPRRRGARVHLRAPPGRSRPRAVRRLMPLVCPKIREDLLYFTQESDDGAPVCLVKDPLRSQFYRFNELQVALMKLLD